MRVPADAEYCYWYYVFRFCELQQGNACSKFYFLLIIFFIPVDKTNKTANSNKDTKNLTF